MIVGVEKRYVCHGKDGAGLRYHNDSHGRAGLVPVDRLQQNFLDIVLDGPVNRQVNVVALDTAAEAGAEWGRPIQVFWVPDGAPSKGTVPVVSVNILICALVKGPRR